MALSLDGLDLLAPGGLPENGSPLRLPIAFIDEDPEQPRQEFDDDSLAELAATIWDRGVRQPVSVRTHPSEPGRWMLNFGARRLRASKLAGLSEISVKLLYRSFRYFYSTEVMDSKCQLREDFGDFPPKPLGGGSLTGKFTTVASAHWCARLT